MRNHEEHQGYQALSGINIKDEGGHEGAGSNQAKSAHVAGTTQSEASSEAGRQTHLQTPV